MRVLIIHRYFWPDTPPYASMLRSIAVRLAKDGHQVVVLTSQPSYGPQSRQLRRPPVENVDGVCVRRVALLPESKHNFVARILNLGIFVMRACINILFSNSRYDAVMAATTPPVMVAWGASLAAKLRGASFIYHCQDIHPELMRYAGLIGGGAAYRFLRNRDTATVVRAARVVVLSGDMRQTLSLRGEARLPHVRIINNFTVPTFEKSKDSVGPFTAAEKPADVFRVLFAGNLGYFQGLEAVIEAARRLANESSVQFVFLGEGAAKNSLMDSAAGMIGKTVFFHGYRPQAEAEAFVNHADLSLITLSEGVCRAAYPSKTITYLSMGSPILVMMETDCELARMTEKRNLGYVVPPGDVDKLVSVIREAVASPGKIAAMRQSALQTCDDLFSEDRCLDKWSALYSDLEERRNAAPIFIIGAGRSGTKYVRSVLAASDEVATVPYDVGYVWRTGNEDLPHDEVKPEQIDQRSRAYIRRMLPKLAVPRSRSKARLLVEKSVPNSLRVSSLHVLYPDAKFIHLIRDGRAVVESAMRQWRRPSDKRYLLKKMRFFPWSNYRYGIWYVRNLYGARFGSSPAIWGPRYAGIDADVSREPLDLVCARQWRRCVETARAQLAEVPAGQVLEVRYEDLGCTNETMQRVCEFVGISDVGQVLDYHADYFRPVGVENWRDKLSPEQAERILAEIRPALAQLGYMESVQQSSQGTAND